MLSNCRRCGRMFSKVSRDICPECLKEREEVFEQVRSYLRENPGSSVPEVVEALDVLLEDVVALIQEGSLILRDFPNFNVACERCGQPIQEGRYCNNCKSELAGKLAEATAILRKTKDEPAKGRYFLRG